MKILDFYLYDQLILIHGSKIDQPFVEIPNDWVPDKDITSSSTALLIDVNNLSDNTIGLVEIYQSTVTDDWTVIYEGEIKTEHNKLYVGDNEGVKHITLKTTNKTNIKVSYSVTGEKVKLNIGLK